MREIKTGDRVQLEGVVLHVVDGDGDYYVELDCGYKYFIPACECSLVDPDALKVGDHVDVVQNGTNRVIREVLTGYRLEGSHDDTIHSRERLTKVEPKPTYKVTRIDDRLQLDVKTTDGFAICKVRMANPSAVTATIAQWERDYDIDADEARRLVAEPQEIGQTFIATQVLALAIRYANGWDVRVGGKRLVDKNLVLSHGRTQPEAVGRGLFPSIEGPYLEKP